MRELPLRLRMATRPAEPSKEAEECPPPPRIFHEISRILGAQVYDRLSLTPRFHLMVRRVFFYCDFTSALHFAIWPQAQGLRCHRSYPCF